MMFRFALFSVPVTGAVLMLGSAFGTPAPSRQVADGQRLFAENCAACHGDDGQRGAAYQTPIWGPRAQIRKFETALGLFEYNQLTMPFNDPNQINDTEKLAIVAYMLVNHGAMPADATLEYGRAASVSLR